MGEINIDIKNYKRSAMMLSIHIAFAFLILLQFIGNYGMKLDDTYYSAFLFINSIFSFAIAFIIVVYFCTMKEVWILFIALQNIVSGTIRITEYVVKQINPATHIGNYNLYLLNYDYNLTNILFSFLIIYSLNRNLKVRNIYYFKLSILCLATSIFGILMVYIDGNIFLNFISQQGEGYKVIISFINFSVIIAIIFLFLQKLDKKPDQFVFSLVLANVFKGLREIYIFCDLGQNGTLLYWSSYFYMFHKLAPLIGITLIFREKYKIYIQITEETNGVKKKLENFKSFILGTPDLVFIIDHSGIVEFINPAAESYLKYNYKIDSIEINSIYDLRLLDEVSKNLREIIKVARRDGMWKGCLIIKASAEEKEYYNCNVMKINNSEEENYAILMTDETHNVIAANKLQKSERKFRQITDSVHDLICKLDKEGRIEYCSPSYTNLFGEHYKYFKKLPWIHNVCQEDTPKVINDINVCIYEHKIVTNECIMEMDSGKRIYVEYIINPVEELGEIDGAIISARDITRRKLAEMVMEKTEAMYSNIFNTCPDMIYVIDLINKKVIEANTETCNFFDVDKKDIINKSIFDVFKGFDFEIGIHEFEVLKEGITIRGREAEYEHKGKKFFLESSYSPVLEEGKLTKLLCITRDISERKRVSELELERERDRRRLDEARQYDQIKTEFFANISHELRTPINVIFSALQVLDMYKDNKEINRMPYTKYSTVMRQNCYRLLRLINNLIDITKIDAGFFKMNFSMQDIVKLIEDITLSVVTYAENKAIEVIFDTDEEEIFTYCDPDKIERIVLNLLSNAIKFTDYGGHITVRLECAQDNVKISVKDDGRGIPEDKIDIIFERFRQVDKSLAREKEGSGIGLSLVKSLVELHNGEIEVYSELNKGSEFIIKIPIIEKYELEGELNLREKEGANIERINIEFSDIYEIS